jgi:hypothetical protein
MQKHIHPRGAPNSTRSNDLVAAAGATCFLLESIVCIFIDGEQRSFTEHADAQQRQALLIAELSVK